MAIALQRFWLFGAAVVSFGIAGSAAWSDQSPDAAASLKQIHDVADQAPQGDGWAENSRRCARDEADFEQIRRTVLVPIEESWIKKDASVLASFLATGAKVDTFQFDSRKRARNLGGIVIRSRDSRARPAADAKVETQAFLNSFSRIDDVEIVGTRVLSPRSKRDQNQRMKEAAVLARFDVRGYLEDGSRREERGKLKLNLRRDEKGGWKIASIQITSQESLHATRAPSFTDVTASTGLNSVPSHLRREAIRRGGYAIAAGDYNGDKKVDLLVGTAGAPVLMNGDGQGHFKPVNVPGLEKETLVKSAAFADFQNSGKQDLLLVRFAPGQVEGSDGTNDVAIYRQDGKGVFQKIPAPAKQVPTQYAMPMTVADFNGDGFLDFYVGYPGVKDFTFFYDHPNKENLRTQGLFINQKGKSFAGQAVVDPTGRELGFGNKLFPHSALAVDYDRDGRMDLVVVDDRGNLTPIYRNMGDSHFEEVAKSIGAANFFFGMGVAAGDLFGDGRIDFVMSNANFIAMNRLSESCSVNWGPEPSAPSPLRVFRGGKGGVYGDVTASAGLDWAGEGLAGVELVDYNLDGRSDILVSNGLWTGTDRKEDLSSLLARSYFLNSDAIKASWMRFESRQDTRSVFMNVLSSYAGDVEAQKPGSARPGMAGRQHKRLFRNEGNGRFTEVGFLEGIDSLADGYVIARADIYGTGRPDIILRSGDPGVSTDQFPTVQVFRNMNAENNHPLKIVLRGTASNADAIGAEVTVKTPSGTQLQQLMGNNGAAQSERALFFGLGKHSKASTVSVRWPSGRTQELRDVPAGSMQITEPPRQQASR